MYGREGIYYLLGRVNHKSAAYGYALLKEKNLYPGQMPLLVTLWREEGLSQRELADRLGVKPPTLNVMIGRMEKNGLILKKQDPKDSRRSRIYFTEEGRVICEKARERFADVQESIMNYFTEEEQKQLYDLLNKFCDCLDEQIGLLNEGKEKGNA